MKVQVMTDSVKYYRGNERQVKEDFQRIVEDFKKRKQKPQLILVVLPFKGGKVYNTIKKLGDLEHRIPTQCCVKKNIFRNGSVNGQVRSEPEDNPTLFIYSHFSPGLIKSLHENQLKTARNEPQAVHQHEAQNPEQTCDDSWC